MTEQSHNILCKRFQTLSLSDTLSKARALAHHLCLLVFCADFNIHGVFSPMLVQSRRLLVPIVSIVCIPSHHLQTSRSTLLRGALSPARVSVSGLTVSSGF